VARRVVVVDAEGVDLREPTLGVGGKGRSRHGGAEAVTLRYQWGPTDCQRKSVQRGSAVGLVTIVTHWETAGATAHQIIQEDEEESHFGSNRPHSWRSLRQRPNLGMSFRIMQTIATFASLTMCRHDRRHRLPLLRNGGVADRSHTCQ
jgi:hypothetical protein